MSWNDGIERKKFTRQSEENRKKYKKYGMSDEAIEKICEFDKKMYNSERKYRSHVQQLDFCDGTFDDDGENPLIEKFPESMSYTEENYSSDRYAWRETLENQALINAVKSLTEYETELVTLIVFEGYTQKDVAKNKMGVSESKICRDYRCAIDKMREMILSDEKNNCNRR